MATLAAPDLTQLRQNVSGDIAGIAWTKAQLNAAMQAIEDVFVSAQVQNALSTAIDGALTANAAQKRSLVKWYLRNRFDRGN